MILGIIVGVPELLCEKQENRANSEIIVRKTEKSCENPDNRANSRIIVGNPFGGQFSSPRLPDLTRLIKSLIKR